MAAFRAHSTLFASQGRGDGHKVLIRECTSPEHSDQEDGKDVLHINAPGFRNENVRAL